MTSTSQKPKRSTLSEEKKPLFLTNPDGTMSEAIPPGYKERTPPRTPRSGFIPDLFGDGDGLNVTEEYVYLYSRHERLFASLLCMQFCLELGFIGLSVYNAEYIIQEIFILYHPSGASLSSLRNVFWGVFIMDAVFFCIYYGLGANSVISARPKNYEWFSNICLVGIMGQVSLAYLNKFNLVIFFLRMLGYVYAKYLKTLSQSMELLGQPWHRFKRFSIDDLIVRFQQAGITWQHMCRKINLIICPIKTRDCQRHGWVFIYQPISFVVW